MRPRTIYVLAVIGVVLYAFPGLLSYDSLFQLDEARRWDLGDQHPPLMSALWRLVELVIAGPFGMLLLQEVALVAGLGTLFARELSARRAAVVALAIAWFPPVLVVMGVIWKDSQMAGYLVLGIALLMGPRGARRWLGLGLLLAASAMRHNGPAATLAPVVLLFARDASSRWRRWLGGAAAWLAMTAGSVALTAALTNHPSAPAGTFADIIEVTDIQGTLRWAGPWSDPQLRELLAGTNLHVDRDIQRELAAHYDPRLYLEFAEHPQPLELSTDPAQHAAVARAWRTLVRREPLAYLHHHWNLFERLLEIRANATPPSFTTTATPYSQTAASGIQQVWFWFVRAIGPLWYVPFIYFAAGLCLVPLARTRLELALLGSGLIYELGMFPVALTVDYRYSQWLILSVAIAIALIFTRRYRSARYARVDSTSHGRPPAIATK